MSPSGDPGGMRFAYLLQLGDNALILGQRLGEWVGHAPELEEELALANFALDYIGQARALFTLAAETEGYGRSEDDLAFLRDGMDYRNVLLVEQPNGNFADTLARQFLFESFYQIQLEALAESSDAQLAQLAQKVQKEIRYHLRHTAQWVVRLGDGTELSHQRMQHAIDGLWRFTGELFSANAVDHWAAESAVGPSPPSLQRPWDTLVDEVLEEATIARPESGWMASGGKDGRHSEHMGHLLADMQFLQRAYPGATW